MRKTWRKMLQIDLLLKGQEFSRWKDPENPMAWNVGMMKFSGCFFFLIFFRYY